jgi:hypothetical protein
MENSEPLTSALTLPLICSQVLGLLPFKKDKSGVYEFTFVSWAASVLTVCWFAGFTCWYMAPAIPDILPILNSGQSSIPTVCLGIVQYASHVFLWIELCLFLVNARTLKHTLNHCSDVKITPDSVATLKKKVFWICLYMILFQFGVFLVGCVFTAIVKSYYGFTFVAAQIVMIVMDMSISMFLSIPPGLIAHVNGEIEKAIEAREFSGMYQLHTLYGKACDWADQLSDALGGVFIARVLTAFMLSLSSFVLAITTEATRSFGSVPIAAMAIILTMALGFARLYFICALASEGRQKVIVEVIYHADGALPIMVFIFIYHHTCRFFIRPKIQHVCLAESTRHSLIYKDVVW